MPSVVKAAVKTWADHVRYTEGKAPEAVRFIWPEHPILVDAVIILPKACSAPVFVSGHGNTVLIAALYEIEPQVRCRDRDHLENAAHKRQVIFDIDFLDVDRHIVIGGKSLPLNVIGILVCRDSVHPDIPDVHSGQDPLVMGRRLPSDERIASWALVESVGEPAGAPTAIDQVALKRSDLVAVEEYVASVVVAVRFAIPEVMAIRAKGGTVIVRTKHDMVI